jgi:hypothetical protein
MKYTHFFPFFFTTLQFPQLHFSMKVKQKKKTVYCAMSGDIIHHGHINILKILVPLYFNSVWEVEQPNTAQTKEKRHIGRFFCLLLISI